MAYSLEEGCGLYGYGSRIYKVDAEDTASAGWNLCVLL